MRTITGDKKARAIAQKGFRREYGVMMLSVSDQIAGILRRSADANGIIPTTKIRDVQAQAGKIIEHFFVGPDGRNPFAANGTTPLADYPRLLNKYYAYIVAEMVKAQHKWMKKRLPEDIYNWLRVRRSRPVPVMEAVNRNKAQVKAIQDRIALMQPDNLMLWREAEDDDDDRSPFLRRPDESAEDYKKRLKDLRIFEPNPLAEYEPAHKWVDPNGYTLSDRIWQTEQRMRQQLDALLRDGIRSGMSARDLADTIERFLHPDRAALRTKKPYGTDGSYYAMLLARTEIARAANQAAFIAAQMNPYVGGIDIARSGSGDPKCPICPRFATLGINGERIREPYGLVSGSATVPIPPFHPQCMDRVQSNVRDDASEVGERIRAVMLSDDPLDPVEPYKTPVQLEAFLSDLLGDLLRQYALALV